MVIVQYYQFKIIIFCLLIQIMQQKSQGLKDSFKQLLCSYNQPCELFCMSKICQKYSGICRTTKCDCFYKDHAHCPMIPLASLIDDLAQKKNIQMQHSTKKAFEQIDEAFVQFIKQLSIERKKFQDWYDNYGCTYQEIKLIALVKNESASIKGYLVDQVTNPKPLDRQKMLEKVHQKFEEIKQKSNYLYHNLNDKIGFLGQEKHLPGNKAMLKQHPKLDSQITNQYNLLISFFEGKQASQLKLLFRASENEFRLRNFYEKCQKIPNTLTLIRTQHNKICGGFTPIPWVNQMKKKRTIPDFEKKTFLFSIDQKQKYTLQDPQCAVVHYPDLNGGPTFGSSKRSDIHISNVGSNNCGHNFHFPHAYYKNLDNPKEQKQKFCGNKQMEVQSAILQWEVFQVIFKE